MAPPATATRRISPLLRVMISAVLVAFAIFVVVYRKSAPETRRAAPSTAANNKPFLSDAPSSEGGNRFAWIPAFPGAEVHDISTKQTRDRLSYGFSFHTTQEFKQVLTFYRDRLQAAGFKVDVKDSGDGGGELHAEDPAGNRSFDAIAAKVIAGSGAEIGVTAVQR